MFFPTLTKKSSIWSPQKNLSIAIAIGNVLNSKYYIIFSLRKKKMKRKEEEQLIITNVIIITTELIM